MGVGRFEVNVREDYFVIWSVVSFVGVETQGDSAIEAFGGGMEDNSCHGLDLVLWISSMTPLSSSSLIDVNLIRRKSVVPMVVNDRPPTSAV